MAHKNICFYETQLKKIAMTHFMRDQFSMKVFIKIRGLLNELLVFVLLLSILFRIDVCKLNQLT